MKSIEQLYNIYLQHPSVQTDTRKLKPGDIYFALKGENFNGNHFAIKAIESGASLAVVDEAIDTNDSRILQVEDVLQTLQQLALHHRKQFNIPFIAITGSNGKTTTKELVHEVLRSHYITYTTQGNFNNHIGIPLTILSVQPDAQMAVIEMGANHQKEIEGYCLYTLPTHGLITNCGKAHLEGFGGIEGVRKGKGELFVYLRQHNGTAFIMNDYDYLREMSQEIREVITYGTHDASLTGTATLNKEFLEVNIHSGIAINKITTNLVGEYNLPNILAAVAIGRYFNVPAEKIKVAIEKYSPSNSRSQLIEKENYKIILDAYNANPTSMRAAIENIAKDSTPNKVLMIGGMMELGDESISEHESIITLINQHQWQDVVLVGGDFANVTHQYIYFNTSVEAAAWFKQQNFSNAIILVKGSRSMKMEKVLE